MVKIIGRFSKASIILHTEEYVSGVWPRGKPPPNGHFGLRVTGLRATRDAGRIRSPPASAGWLRISGRKRLRIFGIHN